MKCKFCFAELEEDVTVCPACGKDQEAPEEAVSDEKKSKFPKWLKITLASVGGVMLAVALTFAVLYGMGIKWHTISAFLGFTEADINYKDSYTVSDSKVEKKADIVIARVGDQVLTNGGLQVYYWMTVRDFASNYYYYLDSIGLDIEKPLNEQVYDEKTGETWQQYFLTNALESWRRYATLVQLAKDSGYVLNQELQDELNSYAQEMETSALESGYANAEALIDDLVSKGSSVATYYEYITTEYTALGYLDSISPQLEPTMEELEAYYTANEETLKNKGYGKDAGKYYDVRHIFITVEGDMVEGEDGTYSYTQEQWDACLAKAQQMLDEFLANEPTEAKFAELAKEHSEDPGSAENGGLYSGLTKDYGFIEEFENWYIDESRKPGDTGIVKNTGSSKVGYHIMYFSASSEIWLEQAETQVLADKMAKILSDAEVVYPMTINWKKLVLGKADISTSFY